MRTILAAAALVFTSSVAGAATLTVTNVSLGTGGGLFPGAATPTLAQASAALSSVGDNSFVALGTGGSLTFSLDTAVADGAGNDISFFDPFGRLEGISVEASSDGVTFVGIGASAGDSALVCTNTAPCATSFDLAGSGLTTASSFRVTAIPLIITGFPQAYDFDGIEVLNTMTPIPLPAALPMLVAGIGGLGLVARRRSRSA